MHGQHSEHKQWLIHFAQTCLLLALDFPQDNTSCYTTLVVLASFIQALLHCLQE